MEVRRKDRSGHPFYFITTSNLYFHPSNKDRKEVFEKGESVIVVIKYALSV